MTAIPPICAKKLTSLAYSFMLIEITMNVFLYLTPLIVPITIRWKKRFSLFDLKTDKWLFGSKIFNHCDFNKT
jgi:hypothetical protein